ncbi:MAG: transposase [Caldilineaceae bacterium SB0662_bin_9]|uniref:Transposase n=1 Tax=Caldilineaceae bacterium SB0662_bin_9 TaxID=2605258 RepID=A0A6B1DYR1_9CHLR|nr:transposase [Caldilineaceae bacterium SB0662_bin_9]
MAYAALARLSSEFDRIYAKVKRTSLLIILDSVRGERGVCKELEYILLFRWFLDLDLIDEVLCAADAEELLSDEHFSVDGTLIEAVASLVHKMG